MKKIIVLVSMLVLFIISLTACNQSSNSSIADDFSGIKVAKWGEADRWVYNNLDELEMASDIIVVGTYKESTTQKIDYRYSEAFGKDIIDLVHSYNTIEVSRVIRGDVKQGDLLRVSQGYAIIDDEILTISDLTPMVKGDTWIFFLQGSPDDEIYWCTGDSEGRYPVSGHQNRRLAISKSSELGVYDEANFRNDIYDELVEKYEV